MKLVFSTQDYENYGTPEEPYWKAKGGEDFIIEAPTWTEEMTSKVCEIISVSNPYFERTIIGFNEVHDNFTTQFEQDQLDYEGTIQFPALRATFEEFVEECV